MKCNLCERETPEKLLEKHHLIPKAKKGKEYIFVCCDCGDQLHQLFNNKQLKKELNTLDKLLRNERIQKWINWIKNKNFGICMKRKK